MGRECRQKCCNFVNIVKTLIFFCIQIQIFKTFKTILEILLRIATHQRGSKAPWHSCWLDNQWEYLGWKVARTFRWLHVFPASTVLCHRQEIASHGRHVRWNHTRWMRRWKKWSGWSEWKVEKDSEMYRGTFGSIFQTKWSLIDSIGFFYFKIYDVNDDNSIFKFQVKDLFKTLG